MFRKFPYIFLCLFLTSVVPVEAQTNEQTINQIERAIAYQKSGLYRRATELLTVTVQQLTSQPDSPLKLSTLLNLANSLRVSGNLEQAEKTLKESQSLARRLGSVEAEANSLIGLGNLAKERENWQEAQNFYQQAEKLKCEGECTFQLQARLEQLSLIPQIFQQKNQADSQLIEQTLVQIRQLKNPSSAAYARIYLAESLIKLKDMNRAIAVLNEVKSLESLDPRTYSTLLGTLAHAQELNQPSSIAIGNTEKALAIAQSISATDLAYQWQWQLGRIHLANGNKTQAIAAYSEAYQSLQMLRRDLASLPTNTQFSFRQTVEPVYRQYIDLLISSDRTTSQENLIKARQVLEALQLAELENFLRQACLDVRPQAIDQIDLNAAVIYPILLPQRLVVIVALPNQPLVYHTVNLSQVRIEQTAKQMLRSLRPDSFIEERLPPAQDIYNWLIRPVEPQLQKAQIKSLVFVLDGALRNLPMAATYDGKQYLIEKYNLALNPGLQLISSSNRTEALGQSTLFAGLSERNSGFSALPGVELELAQIKTQGAVEQLLNQEFTLKNFANRVQKENFSIVHLATHGQFSSKPEDTFLLAWNDKINSLQLQQLLQSKENQELDLLILSACETASGDDRAVLGLAGLAVKSGSRSTIATLWAVQDRSTAVFMTQLYSHLFKPQTSHSQALRQAQLALLANPQTRHPYFWSAYILVGNWL
jgi:CHAT domain-containing protein